MLCKISLNLILFETVLGFSEVPVTSHVLKRADRVRVRVRGRVRVRVRVSVRVRVRSWCRRIKMFYSVFKDLSKQG